VADCAVHRLEHILEAVGLNPLNTIAPHIWRFMPYPSIFARVTRTRVSPALNRLIIAGRSPAFTAPVRISTDGMRSLASCFT
jgi:hypothetical protein